MYVFLWCAHAHMRVCIFMLACACARSEAAKVRYDPDCKVWIVRKTPMTWIDPIRVVPLDLPSKHASLTAAWPRCRLTYYNINGLSVAIF